MFRIFSKNSKGDDKYKVKSGNPYSRWHKARKLGRGGFAEVNLYTHRGEMVAIKKFDKRQQYNDEEFELELKGFQAAGDHPHLVTFISAFSNELSYNLVIEYCKEGPLTNIYKQFKHYTEKDVRDVVVQCTDALEHMRKRGVIHRDIKPDNILVKHWEPIEVVLADFNFARRVKKAEHTTVMNTKLGTPGYKAPEIEETDYRNNKKKYNFKIDVFSLGIVAYELLSSGKRPSYKLPDTVVDGVNRAHAGERHKILKILKQEKKKMYDQMIEEGVPLTPEHKWENISDDAKDVVSKMILPLYELRPDYEQILNSDWGTKDYEEDLASIRSF